jgi:hypothetical protein
MNGFIGFSMLAHRVLHPQKPWIINTQVTRGASIARPNVPTKFLLLIAFFDHPAAWTLRFKATNSPKGISTTSLLILLDHDGCAGDEEIGISGEARTE